MMTQFGTLIHTTWLRSLIVLLFSLLISACSVYPSGASSNLKYVPLSDCCGVITGTHVKNPEFVVSNKISITMLTDKRIIGTWSFQNGINSVVLSEDGTATTTTPSLFTRSGQWIWVSGNIILIEYTNGQYEVVRFDLFADNMAIVGILSEHDDVLYNFLGIKIENRKARNNDSSL